LNLGDHVCELNRQTGEVLFNGNLIVLRPKTFELLFLLASNPQAVHSKSEILASVWQGSVVEDQVVFQSINEIRKEIGLSEVIKTYPRRGYKWEIAVSIVDDNAITSVTKNESTLVKNPNLIFLSVAFILVIFALTFIYLTVSDNRSTVQANKSANSTVTENKVQAHTGILVLPFNVSSLDESQQWLRYGAMEGLIKRISPNQTVTVFHLEDAIEILNRIPVGERGDIEKIFAKSGAAYVLEISLSGQPGELNVVVNIYSRTTRVTKTIQVTSLEHLLTSLVAIFEESSDENITFEAGVFGQQLQNDLIAKAIQFLEVNDFTSALSFVESAVINDPQNIIAHYFVVKINLELGNVDKALTAVNHALETISKEKLGKYEHRLLYFKGTALAGTGELLAARHTLSAAEQLAKENKDWLYYAYNQSMLGGLSLAHQQYDQAYQRYHSALGYQELLNCPMGIAQGHLDFADFYLRKGDVLSSIKSFNKAQSLVQKKNLKQVSAMLSAMEEKISRVK